MPLDNILCAFDCTLPVLKPMCIVASIDYKPQKPGTSVSTYTCNNKKHKKE